MGIAERDNAHLIGTADVEEHLPEPFADVPNTSLREYLREFSKKNLHETLTFPVANLQASRVVSQFANEYAHKHGDQDLEPMAQRVTNEFPNWVSSCYVLTFVPIPKKTARSMFSRGIEYEEMQAYAALGWGLTAANDTKDRKNAIINRQEVLNTVVEALSGNEVSTYIAVDTDEQAIFADYYKQVIYAMENGTVFPEKPRIHNRNSEDKVQRVEKKPISQSQTQEVQTTRSGEIPVIDDESMHFLEEWTINRLITFSDRFGTREDRAVIEAAVYRETLAALEFITAYTSENPGAALTEYEPYPETIEIHRLFSMMEQSGSLISTLKSAGYKVDTLADLYKGFARAAQDEGYKYIEWEAAEVDTQEKGT